MQEARAGRMKKEIQRLQTEPPHGVSCWPKDGKLDHLEAQLIGAKDSPYEGGVFKLTIHIPPRYPFEPPQVQFTTKIYHPNVDSAGRICLDVLKAPPQGSWRPAHNLSTVLTSIQILIAEPNPDDGLMADISHEFKHNRPKFTENARHWVEMYAKESGVDGGEAGTSRKRHRETSEGGEEVRVKEPHCDPDCQVVDELQET